MVKAKASKENKKASAKTNSNHSNHNDGFTKYNQPIVISDDEEVVPSDDEIYAAGVNGYQTIPIWNNQIQNNAYIYNTSYVDVDLLDTDNEVVCLTHNSRRLSKAKSETGKNTCNIDYSEYKYANESVPVTHKRCRLTKDNKLVSNKIFDVSSSDDEKPIPVIRKRRRLTKNDNSVNKIVIDLISSDDENTRSDKVVDLTSSDDEKAQSTVVKTLAANHPGEKNTMNPAFPRVLADYASQQLGRFSYLDLLNISGDEEPNALTCSKTTQDSVVSNRPKYMLYDENTDDEHENNNSVSEEGVWVNINDLDYPLYDLVVYKPKYTNLDEVIIDESSTGEEYHSNVEQDKDAPMDEKYESELLMWDDMVDIDGRVRGTHISNSYIDDEVWEVDSDAYNVRSVSFGDDIASFINDGSTDYETTNDENSDDDI